MKFDLTTTPERSQLMKKIKGKNTKPEILFSKRLWKDGIRYRKNYSKICGHPDIAIVKYKIAIFIDGEFWHGFQWSDKKARIKSNREYWIPKIEKNMERDKLCNDALAAEGWTVFRFWEREVYKNIDGCIETITNFIDTIKA